jgi:hypothetical protein
LKRAFTFTSVFSVAIRARRNWVRFAFPVDLDHSLFELVWNFELRASDFPAPPGQLASFAIPASVLRIAGPQNWLRLTRHGFNAILSLREAKRRSNLAPRIGFVLRFLL